MSLAGARVLVTGGSGFVGGHAMRALAAAGANAVTFGRRPSPGGHVGDVTDADAVAAAVRGADLVVHLATSPGYRAEQDPLHDARVNAIGTLNVLRAARDHGARVLYASTSHVYGATGTVDEDAPTRPVTLYGASKLAGESYCGVFHGAHGVATTVLRFPVLYGLPAQGVPPPNIVEVFTARALAGEPLTLDGGPDAEIDLLEVGEAARAIVAALSAAHASGRTYNVGGGGMTLGEVARAVVHAAGSRSEIRDGPARAAAPLPVLDARRAAAELGFTPGRAGTGSIARYVRARMGGT